MKTLIATGLLATVCVVVACSGPAQLNPKTQRAVDTFACYAHALAPYLPEALDAAETVKGAIQGDINLSELLVRLGHAPEDIAALSAQFQACLRPTAPAPKVAAAPG